MELLRQPARILARHDSYSPPPLEVDKRRRHFAPVAELERPLAQAAARHHSDRIGGAAVDLDVRHQALAIGAPRIFNPEEPEAHEGHAYPQDLSRTHVPVG